MKHQDFTSFCCLRFVLIFLPFVFIILPFRTLSHFCFSLLPLRSSLFFLRCFLHLYCVILLCLCQFLSSFISFLFITFPFLTFSISIRTTNTIKITFLCLSIYYNERSHSEEQGNRDCPLFWLNETVLFQMNYL